MVEDVGAHVSPIEPLVENIYQHPQWNKKAPSHGTHLRIVPHMSCILVIVSISHIIILLLWKLSTSVNKNWLTHVGLQSLNVDYDVNRWYDLDIWLYK